MDIRKYFDITELVDREVYAIHRVRAWKFLDETMLHCLYLIRVGLNRPITVNTTNMQQRGLRHNLSSMVRRKDSIYLSAHMLGKAVDFDVKGMDAEEVREWIIDNADMFPCKIRLENKKGGKPISWVHLDTIQEPQNDKVHLFNV